MVALFKKGPDEKFCSECGEVIRARAEICPKCGVRQFSETPEIWTGKNKLAAALLAFFLGGLGIHRFYLGRTLSGIVYLLFCWTGLPMIIGFIEGIILIGMSESDFKRKYDSQ